MFSHHFRLKLAPSESVSIFALPLSNQYQQVINLKATPPVTTLTSIHDHHFVALTADKGSTISFEHKPLAISRDVNQVQFVKAQASPYLNHDRFINRDDGQVKKLATAWLKQDQAATPNQIVTSLYHQLLAYLEYGHPIEGLHPYEQALSSRTTDCGGFSTLLASLVQSQDIPCRLVVGYTYLTTKKRAFKRYLNLPFFFSDLSMHAWLEIQTENQTWFPVDPSVEWRRVHGQSQRLGGFGQIPADRLVLSYGHQHEIMWQNKTFRLPIIQHPEPITKALTNI